MSAVDLFRNILTKDAIVSFKTDGSQKKRSVDLIEKDEKDNVVTSFTVRDLPTDSIVIKADKFPSPRNFFIGSKGENKRADFIIISEEETAKWIVYIEMKKGGSSKENEIIWQLKGSQCVIAYCESVAEKFHNERTGFLNEYEPRFIRAKETRTTNKEKTAPRLGTKTHKTPEEHLRLLYKDKQKLSFRWLVGKNPS